MAPRRLSDSEKQDLVGRYKAGESTAALAESFGCSPNTVSRTVKAMLPPEAHAALKASRQKSATSAATPDAAENPAESDAVGRAPTTTAVDPSVALAESEFAARDAAVSDEPVSDEPVGDEDDEAATLALDDADDFGDDPEEDEPEEDEALVAETFTELVPLQGVGDLSGRSTIEARPLAEGLLPESVYMLVDKLVELDARPLRDFPELGPLDDTELERHGLCLYGSPRAAKRQCGRSQRVIKVPDTGVFERTSHYLLARGITRLVMDGSLIALDASGEA